MYSRSGGSPSGSSHGTTRWTFFQCTASMSTIRSLSTGMLPIGSTMIAPSSARASAASPSLVLQASADWPLMRTPHEPQIAAWQEQRIADRAVLAVLHLEDAVEHASARPSRSTS